MSGCKLSPMSFVEQVILNRLIRSDASFLQEFTASRLILRCVIFFFFSVLELFNFLFIPGLDGCKTSS